jgi:hypothetical protein
MNGSVSLFNVLLSMSSSPQEKAVIEDIFSGEDLLEQISGPPSANEKPRLIELIREALTRLRIVHFWQVPEQSAVRQAVLAGLVGIFALYVYFYWSRGFDVIRRIRIIGDVLLALVMRDGEQLPSVWEAYV